VGEEMPTSLSLPFAEKHGKRFKSLIMEKYLQFAVYMRNRLEYIKRLSPNIALKL
jgi:hypothetical protein